MNRINIQLGHIARHTPSGAGAQGREAAVIDVAQDLLLQHLEQNGTLDSVAIKGGTALRKLYAGREGRFSLDLDFSVSNIDMDLTETELELVNSINDLVIGPFSYHATERRGKWSVQINSPFVSSSTLKTKLDISSAPWLEPAHRGWISLPIHRQYGFSLSEIKTVRLEENIAEKIARLNRTTTARDMYDLAWIAQNSAIWQSLDLSLIRRLAVLKIWTDTNGMHGGLMTWGPAHEGSAFDVDHWLRVRDLSEFDLEDIGALATPSPSTDQLCETIRSGFCFLADMDSDELLLAESSERYRSLAIRLLQELPGQRLAAVGLY